MEKPKLLTVLALIVGPMAQGGAECCCIPTTEISQPCYEGGFYLEGSWVYLRPTATDADLEYGSFITLTEDPANLNALLLEVEPSYRSGYQLQLGYFFPCSNRSLYGDYFSFRGSGKDHKDISSENQLIQNFLGSSYSTARAKSRHEIDQPSLFYRFDTLIDENLKIGCGWGVSYANIRRDFKAQFADPFSLVGREKSRYWGVGPLLGVDFSFPIVCNFAVSGRLETAVLFGKNRSQVDSTSIRDDSENSFFSKSSSRPTVTNLNCDLGLLYSLPIGCNWGIDFEIGYQLHYYFKPITRINPFNGYVNNPNTFAVEQDSNLGLGGLYLLLSLNQALTPSYCSTISCCPFPDLRASTGGRFEFTSYWLKPHPTNKDLVYARLREVTGSQKNLKVHPDATWASRYELEYTFCPTVDLSLSAFFLRTSDQTGSSTAPGEFISSVNASGPTFVLFSESNSRVKYRIDQYDALFGKWIQFFSCLNMHSAVGLRYLKQERTLTNSYLGGIPPLVTQSKFPTLKSRYSGIGPYFTVQPSIGPFCHFELTGSVGLAFLVGTSKATLDQDNFGDLGFSSNDLRTPKTAAIAPVFEATGGLRFRYDCFSCLQMAIEGGYQYAAYYRTVRLLFPTLLTGLEQINSNLTLQGPYVRGEVGYRF